MPSQSPAGPGPAQSLGLFPWQIPPRQQRWHRDVLLPAWHCHLSAELLGSAPSLLSPAAQPEWLDVISDTEADIGSDLRWSCVASGKPRPAVRWLRDGQPLTSQVPSQVSSDPAPPAPAPRPASLLHPCPGSHPASLLHVPPSGCHAQSPSPGAAIPAIASCSCRDSQQGAQTAPRACPAVTCSLMLRFDLGE